MKNNEKKTTKLKLPGMRVVKTIIAVNICFLIGLLKNTNPFYSVIATILCMQNDSKNSWQVSKNSITGTLIGGIYGFIAASLLQFLNVEFLSPIYYLALSIFLIPIIYSNVHLKVPNSTYISCVVFMSITIFHGGEAEPIYYALNRVIETLIGIGVSLTVNKIIKNNN